MDIFFTTVICIHVYDSFHNLHFFFFVVKRDILTFRNNFRKTTDSEKKDTNFELFQTISL